MPSRTLLFLALTALAWAQNTPDYEKPPISYSETQPTDAIVALQRRLAAGELTLPGDDREALRRVLAELRVPIASQVVVFSKTSLQRSRIRPDHPRVIYYSDSAYVGWVPGGLVEVTVIDRQLGPVFYAMDLAAARRRANPFTRDSDCMSCHGGAFVRDVPGVFVRSVFPADTGEPLLRHGTAVVDDQTPFAERWGGWYVTGYHGALAHRGNALAREEGEQLVFTPSEKRPDELSGFFDTGDYLAPTSDVVALLVLEHQTTMQNALTRAAFATRRMLDYQRGLQRHFKEPETDEPAYDSVKSVIASSAQDIVDRLLFHKEAELPEGIVGAEAFRTAFAAGAVRARDGRSLRDLDLRGRIFAHRCSYMVYSPAFAALPAPLKAKVFERLKKALDARDPKDRHAYLPAEEKERIRAILLETLPEARVLWGKTG